VPFPVENPKQGGYFEVVFANIQLGDQIFEKHFPGPLQAISGYIPDNLLGMLLLGCLYSNQFEFLKPICNVL
jgi:hypothetical protein